jgi:molybdopterin converting factor small subunit
MPTREHHAVPSGIQVEWFALLRECAGKSSEIVEWDRPEATPAQLWSLLGERYRFPLHIKDVRVAVNDCFAEMDTKLKTGDKVVFIPPVSGG